MKRYVVLLSVCILLVGIIVEGGLACTSFAVYSSKTVYGMNFDYPPNEIRFSIEEHEAGAVFIKALRFPPPSKLGGIHRRAFMIGKPFCTVRKWVGHWVLPMST